MLKFEHGFSSVLPKIVPYCEDEFLLSWANRLAKENGMNLRAFRDNYFGESGTFASFDLDVVFLKFMSLLGINMDPAKVFMDTTMFPFEAVCMPEGKQTGFLMRVFHPALARDIYFKTFERKFRFCPECIIADKNKYGYPYVHRIHQLTGVSVCPEHGCRLLESKEKNVIAVDNIDDSLMVPVSDSDVTDFERSYASFCRKILEAAPESNAESLRNLLEDKVEEKGLSGKLVDLCYERFGVKPIRDMYRFSNMYHIVPLFMYIYDCNAEAFLSDLHGYVNNVPLGRCFDKILTDYGIVKMFGSSKQGMEGSNFIMNRFGAGLFGKLIGADIHSFKDILQLLIIIVSNKKYTLEGTDTGEALKSWNDIVVMKHISCGEIIKCRAYEFVFGYKDCKCEHFLTEEKAVKAVNSVVGFRFVGLIKGTAGIVKIHHDVCGETFESDLYKFMERKKCLCCERIHRNDDMFRREVKELVGDSYRILGKYEASDMKIKMLHVDCGHEFEMIPKLFAEGSRCPHCNNSLYYPEFSRMVELFSSGHYKATDNINGHYVKLKDIYSGKEFTIKRDLVKQELFRPTKSQILVLTDSEEEKRLKVLGSDEGMKYTGMNKQTRLLHFLKSKYRPDDVIYITDVDKDEKYRNLFAGSRINDLFLGLKEAGKIRQIDRSLFVFSENLKDYTPEDIAEARYINKNGEIIGEWIDWKVPNTYVVEKRILTVSYNAKDWVRVKIKDRVFKVRKKE